MGISVDPEAGAPADLVELGRIVSAYGVRGWVKVQPYSADAAVLLAAKTWWLKAPLPVGRQGAFSVAAPAGVLASRPQGATIVAQLDSISQREAAEALKGHTVWVPRADFPPSDDDEYYWVDLVGCQFFGEQDGRSVLMGQVSEVLDNGAHAILRIARLAESGNGLTPVLTAKGKPAEVLVPFVRAHVHTVDIANKRLESNWPAED